MKPISEYFFQYSDKHIHPYLEVYDLLIGDKDIQSVLEIGVLHGGSMWLWHSWFPDVQITGVDIIVPRGPLPPNVSMIISDIKRLKPNGCWDLIIDDGSHKLEDQLWVLNNFYECLTDIGILIIEDVLGEARAAELIEQFRGNKQYLHIIDRRFAGCSADDMLLVYKPSPASCGNAH